MKVHSYQFHEGVWNLLPSHFEQTNVHPQLVFVFGARDVIANPVIYDSLRAKFPDANLVISSSAGSIFQENMTDNQLIANALEFEKTQISVFQTNIQSYQNSFEAGVDVAKQLPKEKLKGVFMISDGGLVNGSELVRGLNEEFGGQTPISGGLASNFPDFEKTLLGLNQIPSEGNLILVGFYGEDLVMGYGCMGGWDGFGLEREVTHSEGNILYEVDGVRALDLYKEYLGEYAKNLPQASFLFPLSVKLYEDSTNTVVRTIINVNEKDGSMIFAGDIPVHSKVRFMKTNFDNVIDGSQLASQQAMKPFEGKKDPDFALLVSCIGRRVVLASRVEEELEAARDGMSGKTVLSGFYSNGEFATTLGNSFCDLHNQTMTITTFAEL
ncbi:MAG: FIST signal transduction protein [Bacteroidia bacterium]